MEKTFNIPFYIKAALFAVGLYVIVAMLDITQEIIVPLIFAVIIAIVLHPVVRFFERLKMNRVLAITVTMFLAFLVIAIICVLLFSQFIRFAESFPKLIDKFTNLLNQSVSWASGHFDISPQQITGWLNKTKSQLANAGGAAIGQTLVSVGGLLVVIFLIPVYVFMILFYQPLLMEFVHRLFGKNNRFDITEIITQIKTLIQQYLVGLTIEAVVVAALNAAALLILGVEYAVILAIIGAILNVIPYIGGIIAVALPMMVAFVTKDSASTPLLVLLAYMVIQFIDNHYIIPMVVASKVKINALISIVVVLLGNALWGIPGMFLSIPLTAIVKLIFDHIEPLKPWGFLLGDTVPVRNKIKFKAKKK